MSRIVVINHITLDGVMQAPGRPDEDTRGGFTHGGWATPDNDQMMSEELDARMGQPDGRLVLSRRSYEDMLRYWNSLQGNPFAAALTAAPKYVVSTNAATALA